jgi:hypothetical protein
MTTNGSMGLLSLKVPIYNESARATPIKAKNIYNLRSKLHKLGKKMLLNQLDPRTTMGPKSKTPTRDASEEGTRNR